MTRLLAGGRRAWEAWKRVAKLIGNVQARLILGLFYFVVMMPFAPAVRWGADPMGIKHPGTPAWRPRPEESEPPSVRATRQF